jgi:ribosomal protein S18
LSEHEIIGAETLRGICSLIKSTTLIAQDRILARSFTDFSSFKVRDEDSLLQERQFRSKLNDCLKFSIEEQKNSSYTSVKEFKDIKLLRRFPEEAGKILFKTRVIVEKPIEYLLMLAKDPTM